MAEKSKFELVISAVGVVITGIAAYYAYHANQAATKANNNVAALSVALDNKRFGVEIFNASLPYFEKLSNESDGAKFCKIIVQIARTELDETGKSRVGNLFRSFREQGAAISSSVEDELTLALCDVANESTELEPIEANIASDAIGKYHAVLASYEPQSCKLAQISAERLAIALNRPVKIFRTSISNHYAVTVDAGDDKKEAQNIVNEAVTLGNDAVEKIKNGGRITLAERENIRFLTGAFRQENKGWYIDEDCS